ncbi:G patch domain and ankyrin repeat-containing protein 1 homolog [Belonocnema kinseyi]|uniref:G patch domain and ankyrin repeat-containing protein 1 homolog n=1 Tax=Belonocnema kinseyi TaxID=2817044 RepID=UPI00143E0176|nr:G patch domain and ankyrin repeat-containing protein 1 homolog [Belonocnema kinseyi]
MSFIPSSILAVDRPLKIFVKENNVCEKPLEKKVKSEDLGFKGLEAKIAYEETISQESSRDTQNNEAKNKVTSQRRRKKPTRKGHKVTQKNSVENVSINSIFKAIEQKDMAFLVSNMHSGNVNISDGFGWTPLMSAAYAGNLEIVEHLLKLGANKKIRDKSGLTASQLASKNKFIEIEEILKRRENNSAEASKDSSGNVTTLVDKRIPETNNNFYCSVCNSAFKDTTVKEHESSIVHVFNTKPKLLNAHYLVPKGSKGYQMLINSGWDEEHGLGPSGEGRKYPIKTTLKQDRRGLGLDKKNIPKVTHFQPGDPKAVKASRMFNQRTLKRKDRERDLRMEARKEKALQMLNSQKKLLKHLEEVEQKAGEILTDRQEIVALDMRRNDDRVGMRALQKQKHDKAWLTVGPILIKMNAKAAEELLVKDQQQCDIEINKLRSNLKVKVNELRDLEMTPPVPGLMLQPMSGTEMAGMNQILGKGL